ncbi:hypothetical protein MNBD_NITROSPINAE04-249 [hydrothermal vent metagenome]|uniref:Uncharacterized protein n=1 Tax=hydrothermal vent metagenome TaxID=652676 RepID=A0A3B1BA28_9ZZZZ
MRSFNIHTVAVGIALAFGAILLGEAHGLSFGAKEDAIQDYLLTSSMAAVGESGKKEEAEKRANNGWKLLKRAHIHFMGLGTTALAICIFLGHAPAKPRLVYFASALVGFGAFIYPLFWTFAALRVPEMGKHAAKESLELMAQAGAGAGFIGLVTSIAIAIIWITGGGKNLDES